MSHTPNYEENHYLAVTFVEMSPFLNAPEALAKLNPPLEYAGQVGQLEQVHLYSLTNNDWGAVGVEIFTALIQTDGVMRVDLQNREQRRRNTEEL
ncbi:hypothetical protein BDQ17DRAFT_1352121 [Cyathus striatus]|nr:hypothetical protein BDQ17DRAFT_1352121 [Cyathus striatus]